MKVLIIDDQAEIRNFVKKGLEAESMIVDSIADPGKGLKQALIGVYDAVIVDMYMPGMTGLEVVKKIRVHKKSMPIIMSTVEGNIDNKLEVLKLCDDYITKPFDVAELAARLKALNRRGLPLYNNILEVADLKLDTSSCKVTRNGIEIKLRNKEFALLEYFMRNVGSVLSREMILEKVWDMHVDPFTNTVDVHIRHLRKKIDEKSNKKLIHTVPKKGYKLQV